MYKIKWHEYQHQTRYDWSFNSNFQAATICNSAANACYSTKTNKMKRNQQPAPEYHWLFFFCLLAFQLICINMIESFVMKNRERQRSAFCMQMKSNKWNLLLVDANQITFICRTFWWLDFISRCANNFCPFYAMCEHFSNAP